MAPDDRPTEERLRSLANRLRFQGLIYGPEAGLMLRAVELIQDLRAAAAEREVA